MGTVALAVIAAALALGLARLLRLPAGPLAILAGVGMRLVPGTDEELVRDGLLLSATFLVFSMGAEVDRGDIARFRWASIAAASWFLAVTAVVAFGAWQVLDLEPWTVLYLFLALGSSSTLVVVELLRRRERFFEPVGRFVTGVVMAQDTTVILLLALLGPAAAARAELVWSVLGVVGIAAGGWIVNRWLSPAVLLKAEASEEEHLLFLLAVLFGFGGFAHFAGLPPVLGAYVAGVSLSTFPVGGMVRGYLGSFSDFFTLLFFVLLGAVLSLPEMRELAAEAAFVAVVLVVRPILLLPLARRSGMTVRSSVEAIHLLSQSGEIGLVVVLVGLQRGHVDTALLSMVAAVVVVTMSLTPWLSSDANVARFTRWYPLLNRFAPPAPPQRGHVVVIGCGEGGRPLVDRLRQMGAPLVVVEEDPDVVRALDEQRVPVVRGDGGDPEVVRQAGGDQAAAIVSTMRRREDNTRLLGTFPGVRVIVRVFSGLEADLIRGLGGVPVVEAELATHAALSWYDALPSSPGNTAHSGAASGLSAADNGGKHPSTRPET